MRKLWELALVLSLLLAACTTGGGKSGGTTPPTAGSVPLAAAGDDVAVNRILAGLDTVMGDLQRILVRERRITPEVTDRLQAIYTGPELLNQIDAFKIDVRDGLAGYKSPPGNRLTVVSRLISTGRECVFAEVTRDYSPTSSGPAQRPARLYIVLVPRSSVDDPKGYNPTSWAMLYDGVQDDGTQPGNVCQ